MNLHAQISWQAQRCEGADFVVGTALCEPPCEDFVAGAALCEPPCADIVAGTALCDPPCADFFVPGTALCEPPCADFVAGTASVELENENWRLCSATLVRGVSAEWKMRTGDFVVQLQCTEQSVELEAAN